MCLHSAGGMARLGGNVDSGPDAQCPYGLILSVRDVQFAKVEMGIGRFRYSGQAKPGKVAPKAARRYAHLDQRIWAVGRIDIGHVQIASLR